MTTISLASRLSEATLFALVMRHPAPSAASKPGIIEAAAETLPRVNGAVPHQHARPHRAIPRAAGHECDNSPPPKNMRAALPMMAVEISATPRTATGRRFKGRAYIQLTGRANYRAFTAWMRQQKADCPDFEAEPELVAQAPGLHGPPSTSGRAVT